LTPEFEVKLEVPLQRAQAVLAALARLKPAKQRLRAVYWDVPGRLLQRERLALRTRLENGRWVQTLKGEGAQPLERLEHNAAIGRSRGEPHPVASRHAGTPAGEKLARVLGEGFDDSLWVPLFETDVERRTATVRGGGSSVEIAFDRGRVVADHREAALREIEFESKDGDPRAAVELARQWCVRHGLWLGTTSKAHKGLQLAKRERGGPPATARDMADFGRASLRRIAGEALANALEQVTGNAGELAAGSGGGEHVHQLRVGVRRTRTALRELVGLRGSAQEEALVHVFRQLGRVRDARQVLASAEAAPRVSPAHIARSPAFQDAMLSLLGLATGLRNDDGGARGARRRIRARLAKLLDRTMADAVKFESLDPPRQHRVRKRLKRLRYLAEFTAPLHPDKALAAYLRRLRKVLDALGEYNDDMTALAYYRGAGASHPDAWFAIAWLEAERADLAGECGRRLRKFAKAEPFWS
jgi:triphosphatase